MANIPSDNILLAEDVVLGVENLCMFFGGVKAVNDLSFTVKKGEIFGLIGPNGAGKTTVFNCITQFNKPTSGQLYYRNVLGEVINLNKVAIHDIITHGIARTFQNLEIVKEVSVLENLLIAAHRQYQSNFFEHALGLPILRIEEKVIRRRADKILKFMGLSFYRDWFAWGLPYGVLKKLEIARTLMANPHLIILDEPAAGLNDSETKELADLIRKIRDEYKCSIFLVEHDMGLVMNVCDTILAISFGKKLAIGTAKEIQKNKEVQAAYLGVSEDE
ncbi:MAG: ABC transporter ATP-binding protein [Erysipelotrichia bacterium]|nr:ABC transporter ATP-binding protein [Erysipelotrichia bacterium]